MLDIIIRVLIVCYQMLPDPAPVMRKRLVLLVRSAGPLPIVTRFHMQDPLVFGQVTRALTRCYQPGAAVGAGPNKYVYMARLIMMGDSWACGEWGGLIPPTPGGYRVLHTGTRRYLSEAGHRVVSLARPGSSNRTQVDLRLAWGRGETTLWFLTDPLRDIPVSHIEPTLAGYLAQREHLLRTQLDRVAHLPMHLIGGVCAVPTWVAARYPGFTTVVSDLRTWLLPGREPCENLCRTWSYPDCDPDLLAHWEHHERVRRHHKDRACLEGTPEHDLFWPDENHPNRLAHHRLTLRWSDLYQPPPPA